MSVSYTHLDVYKRQFVYSVDASQPGVTEGKTVTSFDGSAVTQYPDYASWFLSLIHI